MNLIWPCGCLRGEDDSEEQTQLHKPRDNKLYQQKLKPCCMLVITTQKVVALFIVTGLIFLPIGITLLVQSHKIYENDIDYTDCYKEGGGKSFCKDEDLSTTCVCEGITLEIPDVEGKMMLLFGLSNFYQNHRLYLRSQSLTQLYGNVSAGCMYPPFDASQSFCEPFNTYHADDGNVPFYPRGAIASSYFTDTFLLSKGKGVILNGNNNRQDVPLPSDDITWKSDREIKFVEPDGFDPNSDDFKWPKSWEKWQGKSGYDSDVVPDSMTNQHLINWMNPAAFPSFTKLYAKLDVDPGTYTLHVLYRFPVHNFGGQKMIRLTETSWMGGRSMFLGIGYVVIACCCFIASVFFTIISRKTRAKRQERKKKIDEQLVHYNSSNNQITL